MFSQGQKCSFYSVWQWNDMGDSSLNSDIRRKTRWRVRLRFSEHRRELAREACLRQLSDGDRLQWNITRYTTVETQC